MLKRHLARLFTPVAALAAALPLIAGCCCCGSSARAAEAAPAPTYAVVIRESTAADNGWKAVADALVKKHNGKLFTFKDDPLECREAMAAYHPRYTAFVMKPEDPSSRMVATLHKLSRTLDEDPWEDTIWGIVTGVSAEGAMKTAMANKPLTVKTVVATTYLYGETYKRIWCITDWRDNVWVERKSPEDKLVQHDDGFGATPYTEAFTKAFTELEPDLIMSSSHGFQYGFEMPCRKGMIKACDDGLLHAAPTITAALGDAKKCPALPASEKDRVFFPIGNCLCGESKGPASLAPVMLSSYGVRQMCGYTLETWYGKGGMAVLDAWAWAPGRHSLAESFFLGDQRILAELAQYDVRLATGGKLPPGVRPMKQNAAAPDINLRGHLYDRDCIVLYGDPAWDARLDASIPNAKSPFSTKLEKVADGRYRFSVKVLDAKAFSKPNPIGETFTSFRLKDAKVVAGQECLPVVADDFILILVPPHDGKDFSVEFTGTPM